MTPADIAAANAAKLDELTAAEKSYQEANQAYRTAEEGLLSGDLVAYIAVSFPNDPNGARAYYLGYTEDLRRKLENRNVKIREVSDLLRQRVQLEPTKWRGPEGKTDVLALGEFKATSVTGRTFDRATLFTQLQKHGLLERLMSVTTMNKDGQEEPIVKQEYAINYEATLQWLKGNKLDDVVEAAYDEKEKTPQVKGPKPLAFLGDVKEK